MGTRSLTYVYSETTNTPIVCMYRQFDGYPSGHGAELAEFLAPFKIVNGLSLNDTLKKSANGMGCLAAQMIAHFKKSAGNIYIQEPILGQDSWQDYEYHVYENRVVVKNPSEVIFGSCWSEFAEFCSSDELA
jgi:hypothetical protein